MKMRERNQQLKSALTSLSSKEVVEEINNIPKENAVNRQGFAAYAVEDELLLLTMLNTLKLNPQYYRTEGETMQDLRNLIERLDPYFVAQAIVYSRCMGEGMRSINHLAAAILAPFVKGTEWGKRFYGQFDKQHNGCIFRPDDMSEIKDVIYALSNSEKPSLPACMRVGFAHAIESFDTYKLAKYKKSIINIANLVHPNPSKSKATFETEAGEIVNTLNALMRGIAISADTWEVAQSDAGQQVAKAVKEGKLSKEEAKEVLAEAKADNWESLLREGKLGVLAALRNIRNIMKNPREEIINAWCALVTNTEAIRKALILPIHFDLAYDVVNSEFADYDYASNVKLALQKGYINSIPNLSQIFTGKTLVVVDRSGSMRMSITSENKKNNLGWGYSAIRSTESCCYKAGLIAATICKATNADVIKFGSTAEYFPYNKHLDVFALARQIGTSSCDSTNAASAFRLITEDKRKYDRIIFISDNEMNSSDFTSSAYKNYLRICSPYIYCVDLAGYGTTPLAGNKVAYFYGYGPSLYENISKYEFNAASIIDKVKAIKI